MRDTYSVHYSVNEASCETARQFVNVRFWHKADIGYCTAMSAFGGKADISNTVALTFGRLSFLSQVRLGGLFIARAGTSADLSRHEIRHQYRCR